MTKSDLIERLCQEQKLPKGKAELLVNTIFDCLEQALRRSERIEIRGFGSFEIREYKAYKGRNPKTGVPVSVRQKRLPFFKVGKELKERVNGRSAGPSPARPTATTTAIRPHLLRDLPTARAPARPMSRSATPRPPAR